MLQVYRTTLFALGTCLLAIAGSVSVAAAHFCTSACGGTGMQCSRMSVQLGKGCRLECKAAFPEDAVARRACAETCKDQVDVDRAGCETDVSDCRAICDTTANEECANDVCSVALNECRDAVRSATRACVKAANGDGVAIQACIEPGDAGLGLGRAALEDCLTNMTTGLGACIAGC